MKSSKFGVARPDFPTDGCAIVFGASGGLGAAAAGLLGQRGCDVVLTYRSRETEANELAESIRASGRQATALTCDVTDSEATAAVIEAALKQYGRIHTVVSATGMNFRTAPLADLTGAEFAGVVTADVLGFFNIAKSSVPPLRSGGGGSITAIVCSAVERTVPTDALSAAPKAAVAAMVRLLATEEGVYGIRANAVGPGIVDGGITHTMGGDDPAIQELLAGLVESIPARRLGLTEDIAEAVAFLASSKASYITGQRLMVDGGHTA